MSDNEQIPGNFDIVIVEGFQPTPQRMIVVKQLMNGDIHAENNDGEMVIITTDGKVKTSLDGDEDWVHGKLSNFGMAWEVVGFHFGLTDGHNMERTRNERTN